MRFLPIILLAVSNVFMTIAWYGHLKFTSKPLWIVILASWAIAFFEYCFQVPANRLGYESGNYSATQLKIVAEVFSLTAFLLFSFFFLNEPIKWNYVVSLLLVLTAVVFAFAFK